MLAVFTQNINTVVVTFYYFTCQTDEHP